MERCSGNINNPLPSRRVHRKQPADLQYGHGCVFLFPAPYGTLPESIGAPLRQDSGKTAGYLVCVCVCVCEAAGGKTSALNILVY